MSHGAVQSAGRIDRKSPAVKATSSSGEVFAAVQSQSPAKACGNITVGMRCNTVKYGTGAVRFIGPIAKDGPTRIGIELDQPVGLNDGSARGTQYFSCAPNHGVFLKPEKVHVGEEKNAEEVFFGFDDVMTTESAASAKEVSGSGYLTIKST